TAPTGSEKQKSQLGSLAAAAVVTGGHGCLILEHLPLVWSSCPGDSGARSSVADGPQTFTTLASRRSSLLRSRLARSALTWALPLRSHGPGQWISPPSSHWPRSASSGIRLLRLRASGLLGGLLAWLITRERTTDLANR